MQYFNQRRGPYPAREVASLIKMKAEANLGTIGRAIDAKVNGEMARKLKIPVYFALPASARGVA